MAKDILIPLNARDILAAIKELEGYKRQLIAVQERIVKRLLDMGAEDIKTTLTGHTFTGATIDSIDVKITQKGDTIEGVLSVDSEAILFLEFGAGLVGYGHPRAAEFGYGPGTYPGSGNWDNPDGWVYPTSDPALIVKVDSNGQGWGFSKGTPPLMPMLKASQLIERNILAVLTEELGLI